MMWHVGQAEAGGDLTTQAHYNFLTAAAPSIVGIVYVCRWELTEGICLSEEPAKLEGVIRVGGVAKYTLL